MDALMDMARHRVPCDCPKCGSSDTLWIVACRDGHDLGLFYRPENRISQADLCFDVILDCMCRHCQRQFYYRMDEREFSYRCRPRPMEYLEYYRDRCRRDYQLRIEQAQALNEATKALAAKQSQPPQLRTVHRGSSLPHLALVVWGITMIVAILAGAT